MVKSLLSNDSHCAACRGFVLRSTRVSLWLWPVHPVTPQCCRATLAQTGGQAKQAGSPCRGQLASVGALEFGQSSESEQPVLVRGQSAPGLSPIPVYEASRHCLSSLECHRALHRGPSQPVSRADVGHHLNSAQRRESSAEKHARLFF